MRPLHPFLAASLVIGRCVAAAPVSPAESPPGMELLLQVPYAVRAIELRIESTCNRPVVRHSDRSPLAPPDWKDRPGPVPGSELWYPVLDLLPDAEMEAVAEFSGKTEGCEFTLNSPFHPARHSLTPQVIVPAAKLEHWENLLCVSGGEPVLERFYFRTRIAIMEGNARYLLRPLTPRWQGRVSWRDAESADAAWSHLEIGAAPHQAPARELLSLQDAPAQPPTRGQLLDALRDSVGFILRARNRHPGSPVRDGFFLLYDLDARTYRTSHWMWSWGVSIRLLLDAARLPEVAAAFDEDLADAAIAAGRRSLDFQWNQPGHPADGLVTARWNPGAQFPGGSQEFVATADALFLAGWAWAPLFEHTGDHVFLNAAQRLCGAVDRLTRAHPLPPQDWLPARNDWRPTMLNEIAFGVEGFAECHRVHPDPAVREAGLRFIDALIAVYERADGLWHRGGALDGPATGAGDPHHTRGQAWVMEGLLAAHRLAPEAGYLHRAERLAAHLLRHQHPSGCWSFEFDRDPASSGIAEKGSAVWSLLLYRLHAANGDPAALAAARRALWFCLNNRHHGDDPQAAGGIFTSSPNSGIVYRHWYRIACTYTSAWTGLAALEEWRLQEEK